MSISKLLKFIPPFALVALMWVSMVKGVKPLYQAAVSVKSVIFPKSGSNLLKHVGLETGDVIVGVNGVEYSSPRIAFEVAFNSDEERLNSVTIVRNGRRVVLKNH